MAHLVRQHILDKAAKLVDKNPEVLGELPCNIILIIMNIRIANKQLKRMAISINFNN